MHVYCQVLSLTFLYSSSSHAISGMLLTYCPYHFHTDRVAPAITGTLNIFCLSHFQTVPVALSITGILLSTVFLTSKNSIRPCY